MLDLAFWLVVAYYLTVVLRCYLQDRRKTREHQRKAVEMETL